MVKHEKISKKFLVNKETSKKFPVSQKNQRFFSGSQKSQSDFSRCPYCNRELTENEMYCWNCEADITELKNKREKPGSEDDH